MDQLRVAAVQFDGGLSLRENVATALHMIEQAARDGANLIITPEYTNFHGLPTHYRENATTIPGPITDAFSQLAKQYRAYVLVGSLIESAGPEGRFANTSVLLDPHGSIAATYRKIHLFDVELSGALAERESDCVRPGDSVTTARVNGKTVGFSICCDLRFPELYRALVDRGAEILAVPAAFAEFTGRDHWEVLLRARAIESQAFVAAPARVGRWAGGSTYGHSSIIDPWGSSSRSYGRAAATSSLTWISAVSPPYATSSPRSATDDFGAASPQSEAAPNRPLQTHVAVRARGGQSECASSS